MFHNTSFQIFETKILFINTVLITKNTELIIKKLLCYIYITIISAKKFATLHFYFNNIEIKQQIITWNTKTIILL